MSTNDLQALFTNMKSKSRDPSAALSSDSATGSPGPAFGGASTQSPPPPFSQIHTGPSTTSSNTASNSATAQSLLNLLNFGSAAQPASNGTSSHMPTAEATSKPDSARPVSASDLVARFMSPTTASSRLETTDTPKLEDQGGGGTSRHAETSDPSQNALLKLLSKAQPTHSSRAASAELPRSDSEQRKLETPGRGEVAQNSASTAMSKSGEKSVQANKPLFTYQNPFEQLNASRQSTPKINSPVPKPAQSPIFKGLSDLAQPSIEDPADITRIKSPSEIATRKKLTPRSASARAERLARENSARSTGTPEPAVKEESPAPEMEELPITNATDPPADPSQDEVAETSAAEAIKESPQAGADEWEDAEESPTPEYEPRKVPVYNFPIRPFVSITLQLHKPSEVDIREDGVMEISRLKKEFDQVDRSLVVATTKYIAYALVKNGGIRIIRQDDGVDRQVFKHSHDRIFNVAFCTTAMSSPPSDDQAVLGTGVSGTVYYATLSKDSNDLFEKNELDTESLAFPPWPPADEHTAGGVLKTRAKRSSRHPGYFAIGRGSSIHLIWPANAMYSRYGVTDTNRQVDMEKLYQERNLQISTGKAGKDFAFSEDDTLIVSLDKTGRLRFWDIRDLTDETNATASRVNPIRVDMPLLSLSTASPAEKSWPTSVLFVDKTRPYIKGGALRYVLVGLRQNHTLQLWDIGLCKAVQELNFPHENETDGVCSVSYHPGSGIIVVGHPTRNSFFFIHLSAPRYNLSSSTTQAAYIQRVAAKDPAIPTPESTACMSGIREISFASKGQLRSVELLPIHKASGSPKVRDEKSGLFELYAVHSKGVTCLTITKEDLGWDASSKVLHDIDAAKEGIVSLKELKLGSIIEETRSKSPAEETLAAIAPSKSSKKKSKKAQTSAEGGDDILPQPDQTTTKSAIPSLSDLSIAPVDTLEAELPVQKESKKSKKKAAQATDLMSFAKTPSRNASPAKVDLSGLSLSDQPSAPQASEPATSSSPLKTSEMDGSKSEKFSVGISGDWLDKEIKKIEQVVSKEFRKEFNNLYNSIQKDRLMQDSASSARHETVLRLISNSLSTNIEKLLHHTISTQINQVILPSITNVTLQAVQAQVGDAVANTMHQMMPRELGTQLPAAIGTALSNPQLGRAIYENVTHKIAKQTEALLMDMTSKHIVPAFKTLSVSAAEDAAAKVEARLMTEIRSLEGERRRDATRMEKFGRAVQGMAETLQSMSETQVTFQNQLMQDRQQLVLAAESNTSGRLSTPGMAASPALAPISRPTAVKPKTQEELDQDVIASLMREGKYEAGSIKWLHSSLPQQVALFDNLFVRFTPEYLATDVSSLVAFSIAITVAASMKTNVSQRLEWIQAAFNAVDLQDAEIADLAGHAPALLSSLIQKLEGLYMTIAEQNIGDPVLRQIPPVAEKAREMRAALGGSFGVANV